MLANVAVLVVIMAVMGVLAVVSGVVDGFDRWATGHRIAPAVLVGAAGFPTWLIMRGWDELQIQKWRTTPRDPEPRDPVGSS